MDFAERPAACCRATADATAEGDRDEREAEQCDRDGNGSPAPGSAIRPAVTGSSCTTRSTPCPSSQTSAAARKKTAASTARSKFTAQSSMSGTSAMPRPMSAATDASRGGEQGDRRASHSSGSLSRRASLSRRDVQDRAYSRLGRRGVAAGAHRGADEFLRRRVGAGCPSGLHVVSRRAAAAAASVAATSSAGRRRSSTITTAISATITVQMTAPTVTGRLKSTTAAAISAMAM